MKGCSQNTVNGKKVFIQTYGCQMNEYDTDKMFEVLRHENYFHTDSQEDADLIILNTCSIREKAEHKVYSELGRLRDLKTANPELKIGVGGCVAQQEGDAILRRDSNVDFVFGTDNLFELPRMLRRYIRVKKSLRPSVRTGRRYVILFRNILIKNFSIPESKLI